jgi:hypothetical protein
MLIPLAQSNAHSARSALRRYAGAVAVCAACRNVVEDQARFCPECGTAQVQPKKSSRIEPGSDLDIEWAKVVVGERIGEGGMGVVYRAGHQSSALMLGHPASCRSKGAPSAAQERDHRASCFWEATALRRLSHPNIVHSLRSCRSTGSSLVLEPWRNR